MDSRSKQSNNIYILRTLHEEGNEFRNIVASVQSGLAIVFVRPPRTFRLFCLESFFKIFCAHPTLRELTS